MNNKDRDGREALHHSSVRNDGLATEQLIKSGADPNRPDKLGLTPLHLAAQEGAVDAARMLVTYGADVDSQNSYGNTPLWVAVANYRGDGAMIEFLLQRGADPMKTNNSGKTPRELAHLISNYDVSKYFP